MTGLGEFALIQRYFKRPVQRAALGVGDDCALLNVGSGQQLAVSSDMLVQGRHFFADVDPFTLGHKALAVNLSDLAACGAQPLAFTLALALPSVDERWLAAFSRGLFALADAHACELVGGDTTRGPLTISITVFGEVPVAGPRSQALLRSGARDGFSENSPGCLINHSASPAPSAKGATIPDTLTAAALRARLANSSVRKSTPTMNM